MSRTSAYLAAVASSAVPGLDPVAVRASRGVPGNRFDVGFVTDTQRRAWVVRVPTTPAVGAQLDTAEDLLPLLAKRVPYAVPSPRGFARVKEGRAVVYPYLHGRSVVLDEVAPGPGVAAEVGRAIAALHNVDRAVFDEAGLPVYDAEVCRTRHLADLDRAAATGHVPTALLGRWERVLEDVSVWRFAPTPTHGDLTGGRILVIFGDEDDSATAAVRAVTGWEHAKVADPADDFAVIAAECSAEAFESIVEAYSVARIERPDRQLRLRARVTSELRLLNRLLDAVTAEEPALVTRRAAELQELDERVATLPPLMPHPPTPEARPTAVRTVTPAESSLTDRPGTPTAPTVRIAPVDPVTPVEEDAGEDTQPLRTGPAADATTVIPDHELDKVRGAEPPGDDSWFQVIEPDPGDRPAAPEAAVTPDPEDGADSAPAGADPTPTPAASTEESPPGEESDNGASEKPDPPAARPAAEGRPPA